MAAAATRLAVSQVHKVIDGEPGFWAPDDGHGARFTDKPTSAGLPSYGLNRIEACLKYCKQLRTAVDGGAYIGTWSVHLGQHFKHVLAFEPVLANYECLVRNVSASPAVQAIRAALTDKSSPMTLAPSVKIPYTAFSGEVRYSSKTTKLFDGITIDSLGLKCLDLLKLDVEGFEYAALVGGCATVLQHRPVIMIEERAVDARASKLLVSWGMHCAATFKRDKLFTW